MLLQTGTTPTVTVLIRTQGFEIIVASLSDGGSIGFRRGGQNEGDREKQCCQKPVHAVVLCCE
jgi:hypothetical protein